MRKGIILAGGTGSRLYPLTYSVSKQLLPVFDKPMIYYALSTMMLSGIQRILIISGAKDLPQFTSLLGNGSSFGLNIEYAAQESPLGIAHAFILGEKFIGNDPVALILGDNFLFGDGLGRRLQKASLDPNASIFAYKVINPKDYGIVELDESGAVISIEEKPSDPKSSLAIIGVYFYPPNVVEMAKNISPSIRGELEITDINQLYLDQGQLKVERLGRGYTWLDAGTEGDLLEAANFVAMIERRQGVRIGCIEEVAWRMGWISDHQLKSLGNKMRHTGYGRYILDLGKK